MYSARIKGRALKRQSSTLCFSTNTYEVTMQVKRSIRKAIVYITNTFDCVESLHYFAWFVVCFPIVIKALLHGFDPYLNVLRTHVPVLLAMQWSIAWRSAFYRGREHLWIVFSFNAQCTSHDGCQPIAIDHPSYSGDPKIEQM